MPKRLVSLRLGDEAAEALAYLGAVGRRSQADLVAGVILALRDQVRARAFAEAPHLADDRELRLNHPAGDDPNATVISSEEQRALWAVLRAWGAAP